MATDDVIGRTDELQALTDVVAQAAERGGALLVVGEPGIGKSTLINAATSAARAAGLRVLATTGAEIEAQLPFVGLYQLLGPLLAGADALPVAQRRALRSAFGTEDGPPPEPFMIALAVLNLLTDATADGPVVVAVDDLHWLDQPSQEVLAFVARRVSDDPIVIIGATRPGRPGPYHDAGLPEMILTGLDDAAARALLTRTAGDLRYADRERILREALGNPLALVELPVAWRATAAPGRDPTPLFLPLTTRLERAFAGRLAELPPPARDAVLIAAVNSGDALFEVLAAATVLAGQPVTAEALDAAAGAGLLRFDDLRVRFRHPLVRSGVLQSETTARRQAAHAALAGVLVDEPYRCAWHHAQSIVGPDDQVADELAATHSISLRRGSISSAIRTLERSAQLTTDPAKRARWLLLAAEHAFGLGRADMVDRLLEAASRDQLSDLDRARMEWLREIFNDGVPGDATRVMDLCDIAQRSAAADDVDLALNLLLAAALRCWWADTGPAARQRVVAGTRQLKDAEDDPRYTAALAVAEPVAEGRAVVETLSQVTIEHVTDPAALRLLGMAAHAVGEPVRAVDLLDRAETRLREQGRLGLLAHVLNMQILDRLELGDWDRAATHAEEAGQLAKETGQPIWDTGTQLLGAMIVALRGGNDRAQSLASEAYDAASGRRLNNLLACVQLVRGFGWVSAGNHTDAYHALRRLFDPADPCFHETERFHGVMFLAEAAVHAGYQDDARTVIAELDRVARITPSATLRVHLSYARAVLADDDDAENLYLSALGGDLVRWPWARARLELAYGSWQRRRRRAVESRPLLRAAQTTFSLIGAPAWAEQARSELRAAGERTQRTDTDSRAQDVLSGPELQVARLAAQGLSNREIGQRLFLSARTVGSHLYRIFPKLNITSRAQLAARLDN
jgi:DNA-binding CsgD family transcriptional regulator/energy-coupling factor transporter ATP-binding protein EcfA2